MKASVYIETTILSYLVALPSRDVIVSAHQQLTLQWWNQRRPQFECFISQVVLDEIGRGDPREIQKRQQSAVGLETLDLTDAATALAEEILRKRIVPSKALPDATHIAIAAASGMDFLLTWNCAHIANAQIESRIGDLCRAHGLQPPVICTPEELMVG